MAEMELEKERLERDRELVEAAEEDVYGDLEDGEDGGFADGLESKGDELESGDHEESGTGSDGSPGSRD